MTQVKRKDGNKGFESYKEHMARLDLVAEKIMSNVCDRGLTFGDIHQVLEMVKTKLNGINVYSSKWVSRSKRSSSQLEYSRKASM